MLELTGRTYIFAAATLLLLAGSLRFYSDFHEEAEAPEMLMTQNAALMACDANALESRSYRLGCQRDTNSLNVQATKSTSTIRMEGGAKMISLGN